VTAARHGMGRVWQTFLANTAYVARPEPAGKTCPTDWALIAEKVSSSGHGKTTTNSGARAAECGKSAELRNPRFALDRGVGRATIPRLLIFSDRSSFRRSARGGGLLSRTGLVTEAHYECGVSGSCDGVWPGAIRGRRLVSGGIGRRSSFRAREPVLPLPSNPRGRSFCSSLGAGGPFSTSNLHSNEKQTAANPSRPNGRTPGLVRWRVRCGHIERRRDS